MCVIQKENSPRSVSVFLSLASVTGWCLDLLPPHQDLAQLSSFSVISAKDEFARNRQAAPQHVTPDMAKNMGMIQNDFSVLTTLAYLCNQVKGYGSGTLLKVREALRVHCTPHP